MQEKIGLSTRECSHYENVYQTDSRIKLLGLKAIGTKQLDKTNDMINTQIIINIKVNEGSITFINKTEVGRLQERCRDKEVTIVSNGSQNNTLLTYGVVMECNGVIIHAARIVPSYVK